MALAWTSSEKIFNVMKKTRTQNKYAMENDQKIQPMLWE